MAYNVIPTSAEVLSVMIEILVPDLTVRAAGLSSEVVAASVAPTGIIAVAPEKSTQTFVPGWKLKAAHQSSTSAGTVI
jgi:hypothetical protein